MATDDTEPAARLLSGDAWRGFCRALERTGEFVLGADVPDDDRTRAEGFKYLLGLTTLGIRQALELADREHPSFVRIEDPFVKWGAENADNHYLHTHIRSDRCYRIRGERGSCMTFLVEVKEGFMHLGDVRNFATMTAEELEIDDEGRFEIIASAERPAALGSSANWLPLDPDASQITIRQYLCDWQNEEPARFTIECLETIGLPPARVDAPQMAAIVDDAGHFIECTASFWAEWMPKMRDAHVPGRLQLARSFVGGADDIRYGNDVYELAPDEALIIETDVPDARYWHYQLGNSWFVTMDYANRTNSINGSQAHLDPDGRFRCVIAHRDPGCPNWLDTGGDAQGMIQYRYVWTNDSPRPSIRRVALVDVWQQLPAGTPRVTPAERRDQIALRQRAIARRNRV